MTNEELLNKVENFKQMLVERATSSVYVDAEDYKKERLDLLNCRYKHLVPSFVRECRTLDEFWEFIKRKFGHYSERREFLKEEFLELLNKLELNTYSNDTLLEPLKTKFNSEYITQSIELMLGLQSTNPTEAIGKAKELIESCCKTILDNLNVAYNTSDDISDLTKKTFNKLNLLPDNINDDLPLSKTLKQILGNLRGITSGLAELRNPYGSGHGKPATYKGLSERHAKLAVGCCATLVNFLWDCYEYQLSKDN